MGQLRNLFASWKRFGYIYFFLSQNEIFYPRRREKQKYFPFHFRCAKRNWYIYFSCFYYSPKNQLSLPSEIRWQVFLDSKRTANPHLHDRWRRILFVGRDPKKVEFVRNSTFEQNSKGYFSAKDRLDFSRDFFFEAPRSGFSREIHIVFAVESWIAKTDILQKTDISTEILEKVLQMHILSTFLDSKEVERIGKSFFLFCEKIFPSFLYPRKIIFATKMSKEKTKDPQKISLEKMGLRSAKAVALHILQENTHESNLVPDISNAPYLRGNLGQTHLAPIPGFPPFCDDMYVYGRLGEKDAVWVGNQVRCTSGTNGSASLFVSRISNLCQEVWPRAEYKYIHVSLVHTVRLGSGGKICETIAGIEKDSNGKLERQWRKLYGNPVAFFLSKLDVSEVPLPPTSWRVAAIPTTFGSQLHGFVPTRLHPRLFGNFGSFEVGRASRGKPQLFPAGRYSFRKFAGLHLGQHQFCWKPRMHFLPNYWWTRNHHQILQQVCFSNRSWRCAEPSLVATCRVLLPAQTNIYAKLWPIQTFFPGDVHGWRYLSMAAQQKNFLPRISKLCWRKLWTWQLPRVQGCFWLFHSISYGKTMQVVSTAALFWPIVAKVPSTLHGAATARLVVCRV